MREVIPYCIENDPEKPNFIIECINHGLVRPYCAPGPDSEPLNPEEIKAVKAKTNAYYKENWHRALLSTCLYQSPEVANSESYSLPSFDPDKEPIYFHVDFLKPGKNTYFVEHFTRKPKLNVGTVDFFFDAFRDSNPDMDNPALLEEV